MTKVLWKRSCGWMLAILMAALCPAQAQARPQYAAYEGLDAVQEGRGGTRVIRNGMDYWTTGAPPRRYRITGVITDRKCLGTSLCGNPVERPAIALEARANGGDALIVLGKSSDTRGMLGGASSYAGTHGALGFGWSGGVADRAVTMLVIQYLPDGR